MEEPRQGAARYLGARGSGQQGTGARSVLAAQSPTAPGLEKEAPLSFPRPSLRPWGLATVPPPPPQARPGQGALSGTAANPRLLTHEVGLLDELLQQREALLELVGAHVHGRAAPRSRPALSRAAHALRSRRRVLKGARMETRQLPPPHVPSFPVCRWRRPHLPAGVLIVRFATEV